MARPKSAATLEEREGIVGKKCKKCSEWKPLSGYSKHKGCIGGVNSRCKDCERAHKEMQSEHRSLIRKKYYEEHKEVEQKRSLSHYHTNRESHLVNMRKWKSENGERIKQYSDGYKEQQRLVHLRRRARKKELPDSFSEAEKLKTMTVFGDSCSLTECANNLHWDHVIPLATGHGGTIHGNMIPLRADINISKSDFNIFTWFENNGQRFGILNEKFNKLIEWLASTNSMTIEEYKNYVYWCHDNPRDIAKLKI